MKEMNLEEARALKTLRASVLVPGSPLRFRPCIVHGPNGGYCVVTIGFATTNELPEVR